MQGEIEIINTVTGRLFFLFSALSLLLLCGAPELFSLLAPSEYREALAAVYPIALSIPFSFLATVMQSVLTYFERTYLITAASVSSAFVTLFLNLFLTLRLGYTAAAVIILISSLTQLAFYRLTLRSVSKKPFFPRRSFIEASVFSLALAPAIYIFRGMLPVRIIFAAALILTIIPRTGEYRALIRER